MALISSVGFIKGMASLHPDALNTPGEHRLRSSRRPLMATGFRVHAHPADSADTPRQTDAHRTRCSPLQTHARAWCWGRIDTQDHTTVNPTRDRMPPGCHVYGSARDSRGNAGHKTAMRHTRMPSSLSPALLPRASVTRKLCTRQEGRGAHTRRGGPGPCLASTYTDVVHAARGRRAANKHGAELYSLLSVICSQTACDLCHNCTIVMWSNVRREKKASNSEQRSAALTALATFGH